jgi:signal transduction histidine kinase
MTRTGTAPAGPDGRRASQGELLGAITLEKTRNEPASPADDKLLTDLASQAGLVLRNVRLTAELRATIDHLRASRRRLVRAQDDERQRIERNLHDGAQQQLVALIVQLSVLEEAAGEPDEVRQLAGQLRTVSARPSTTCAPWHAASIRGCSPTAAWRWRCRHRLTGP